jgi:hypothetical protein
MSIKAMAAVLDLPQGCGLNTTDVCVLLCLANRANDDDGQCWPGTETLRRESKLSERGLQIVLRRLEKAGWIATVAQYDESGNGRQTSNLYTLTRKTLPYMQTGKRVSKAGLLTPPARRAPSPPHDVPPKEPVVKNPKQPPLNARSRAKRGGGGSRTPTKAEEETAKALEAEGVTPAVAAVLSARPFAAEEVPRRIEEFKAAKSERKIGPGVLVFACLSGIPIRRGKPKSQYSGPPQELYECHDCRERILFGQQRTNPKTAIHKCPKCHSHKPMRYVEG